MHLKFPTRTKTGAAVAASLLAVGLTACGGSGSSDDSPSGTSSATSSQSADSASSSSSSTGKSGSEETFSEQPGKQIDLRKKSFPVSADKAVSTATDKVGSGGTLHAVELDHSDSARAWQWDVKIMQGGTDHKVVIDAVRGKIVKDESESSDDTEKAIDLKDPMTFDAALERATEERDGQLREWKLEYDDGHRAYQFDIAKGGATKEVTVDVDTGDVTVD